MKSIVCGVLALAALAGTVQAQPYYARGDFNGWSTGNELLPVGGGMYQATIGGLTAGATYGYKAAVGDWSYSEPGSNGVIAANAGGSVTIHFFSATSWSDGWQPSAKARVGYVDPGMFGWELVGDFEGWGTTPASLTNLGGGLYSAAITLAPGTYQGKFRKPGDWSYSIGDDFGNSAANLGFTVNPGDTGAMVYLDLPNGRWQITSVPTPGSLALLGLGGLVAGRRRR